jgi:hypothetical protein
VPPITEDRVRVMINETLKAWERDYGDVRHRENTEKFNKIEGLLDRVRGAIWAVGGLATFIFTAFKIYEAMRPK